jgi:hypothetical protein
MRLDRALFVAQDASDTIQLACDLDSEEKQLTESSTAGQELDDFEYAIT